ncbi:hypothetical protein [Candidatus Methanodesulfokora washburnensis]|jgi:hypothetical protein|uniref:Uncharacterized protein n=1 Tax=Candidatus Methanodesulfokora washburnensis TaxID=2478471 RepID=A0A3R9R0Y6_9CREN|nr:hypothetical protein [Candidatus Methanodesulfokores washburnensis]RSN78392.1 hypothetical protein D6D85_01000 [Candidatus Methanodesulfokores washburnensis]
MGAREQAGSEEVMFEDPDLVYIISFDLGAPVETEDLKELLKWFSERYKMVEGIWIPPKEFRPTPQFVYRKAKELGIEDPEKIGIEELMKNERLEEEIDRALEMFEEISLVDHEVCHPEYLELSRYVRLKLTDLNVSIKDQELHLNGLRCEPYLLLHSAGICVLTIWIHLNGNFSTDDLINIGRKLYDAECTIKDPFGNIIETTLYEFVGQIVTYPLYVAVLFKGRYGSYDAALDALKKKDITSDKIKERLRTPLSLVHRVVCIRKHRCDGKCTTAEDAVERHLREIAGISGSYAHWRYYREGVARKFLGENLSLGVDYAIFVTAGVASIFLGSAMLNEELKSEEDEELGYRRRELFLVQPIEFLLLSDMILRVYTSIYRNKFRELRERRRRGETVRPSEIAEIKEGLMEGLEEYRNVSLFIVDPERSIMEHGKEMLGLSGEVDTLKSLLKELDDMARTFYEEEALKKQEEFSRAQVELAARQEDLSRKQVLLTILFGIFGAFQALEYLEPKLGFLYALTVTLTIFTLIYLSYYKLYPYIRGKLHLFRRKKLDKSS